MKRIIALLIIACGLAALSASPCSSSTQVSPGYPRLTQAEVEAGTATRFGVVNAALLKAAIDALGTAGAGDMTKAVYDDNDDGVIDTGALPDLSATYWPTTTDLWTEAENTVAAYLNATAADLLYSAIGHNHSGVYLEAETDPTALLTAGTDNVKDSHIDWGTGAGQVSAGDIPIVDSTEQFTATTVEAALDELHDAIEGLGGGHDAVTLGASLGTNLLGLSTQEITLDTQTANKIFAGPATGDPAEPTFRDMVDADIPAAITRDSELSAYSPTSHDHSGVYEPVDAMLTGLAALTDPAGDRVPFYDDGTPDAWGWKEIGTSAGNLAAGDHTHSGVYEPADADLSIYAGITPSADVQTLLGYANLAAIKAGLSIDDLVTLSGVADGATHLGEFTGSTITDNVTTKAALQLLETAIEGLGGGHAAVTLGSGIGGLTLSTQELGLSARLEGYHDFVDPDADRIWFWDDSEGVFGGLSVGNSLAITTTAIDTIQDIRTTSTPQFARIGVGQAADATNPISSSGFSVDPDGNATMKSATYAKASGVAGDVGLYEANSTDTHAAGFRGPASITGDGAYRGQFPNARPGSANMVQAWTNVGESGSGTAADPYVQSMSWVDMDGYLALASLGTNIATALGVNAGSAGAPVINGGALGTPSSGTLTNCTGLPISGLSALTATGLLTGWTSGAGTVAGTDTIREGMQKIDGNVGLKADITHTVQHSADPDIATPSSWTLSGAGLYGQEHIASGSSTASLPAVVSGYGFSASTESTNVATLDPNGTEVIYLNGTSCGAGVTVVSDGTAGSLGVIEYRSAGAWKMHSDSHWACGT